MLHMRFWNITLKLSLHRNSKNIYTSHGTSKTQRTTLWYPSIVQKKEKLQWDKAKDWIHLKLRLSLAGNFFKIGKLLPLAHGHILGTFIFLLLFTGLFWLRLNMKLENEEKIWQNTLFGEKYDFNFFF